MSLFTYRARDNTGNLITGELDGANAMSIKETLFQRGLFPISVRTKPLDITLKRLFSRKPKTKDLANMTRQFQVMFAAGMPMDRILLTLARQTEHEGLRNALVNIQKDVAGGVRLSQAFRRYPHYFDLLFVSMLEAGESGGVLDRTLKIMASTLLKEYQTNTRVKSATLYPKMVMGALLGVGWMVLVVVIPPFKSFYAQHQATLPLPTRILMGLSDLIVHYWYLPILLLIAGYLGWRRFAQSAMGKRWLGYVSFNAPVFGPLNLMTANARFAHLTSSLYRAGLPFSYSLNVVAETVPNVLFSEEVRLLRQRVEAGSSLSQALDNTKYFAPMVKEMCAVGEQTGKLDETLEFTALFYDEEIDQMLKNMTTLIEPILLFLLFGAVLLLALAVYLPVWNLSNVVMPQ